MAEDNKNDQLNSIIEAIGMINTAMSIPIDLPVCGKKVYFRQITTAQEKALIKNLSMNESKDLIPFLLPILKTNCETKDLDLDNLSILDLYCVLMMIRIYSIGPSIKLRIQKKGGKEYFTTKVELADIYNKLVENIEKFKKNNDLSFTVESKPYVMHCSLPTTKELAETNNDDNETFYDNIFITASQLVKSIDVVSNTGESKTIPLSDFQFSDRIKILEQIPNIVLTELYEKSVDLIKDVRNIVLFDFKFENQKYQQIIDILSTDFFTVF